MEMSAENQFDTHLTEVIESAFRFGHYLATLIVRSRRKVVMSDHDSEVTHIGLFKGFASEVELLSGYPTIGDGSMRVR